ncbi:CCA tRNA nucleotidyltransferase [Ornithinibacillus halotolerans]|uniref:CCA-adding enzyme n=1 Tax=Ornithinibacillus halotolerans TaxID=1274357 RepID=A0A916W2S9_9BACI|nr:CCA tRNA nucleotidyltransferase [Ornithinibacillus halotolerans]GGA61470.1 CCA-adding enzyme [Ornithinibacillus halotolerans]
MIPLTGPFQEALSIINTIEDNGYEAYFVGGCIRDYLLQRPIGDIDITTSAKPEEIQSIFTNVIPVGIEHGTVIVRHNHINYEVTTFRLEGEYSDHRHPDYVEFVDKIDMDLARRDFTINALAMNKHGEIIDLFGGQQDLTDQVIRTVGNGHERFKEDPLRILRAIRFSSQLGFTLADDTITAIRDERHHIQGLAVERITVEITKLFAGKHVDKGLRYLDELELSPYIPVFKDFSSMTSFIQTIKPVFSLAEIICLIHQLQTNIAISDIVKQWKCSNRTRKEALLLNDAINYYKENGIDNLLVYKLLPNYIDAFGRIVSILFISSIEIKQLYQLKEQLPIHTKNELKINGHDILDMFPTVKKGPWIHELLMTLEKLVVIGDIPNEKTMLKEWIKWNPPVQK